MANKRPTREGNYKYKIATTHASLILLQQITRLETTRKGGEHQIETKLAQHCCIFKK